MKNSMKKIMQLRVATIEQTRHKKEYVSQNIETLKLPVSGEQREKKKKIEKVKKAYMVYMTP